MINFIKKYKYWIGGILFVISISLLFKGCKDNVVKFVYEKPNKQIDSLNTKIELLRDTVSVLELDKKESKRVIEKLTKNLSKIDKDKILRNNESIKNTINNDTLTPQQIVDYWSREFEEGSSNTVQRK